MALWCRDLPTVTVPQSVVPKAVTLIVPYYMNASFLERQVSHWTTLRDQFGESFRVVLVDDGSPEPAKVYGRGAWLRLFRILEDRRWNWIAARNIGAFHAADGWLLMTDMDHMVPRETLQAVIHGVHRVDTIYAFSRREHSGTVIAPHPNSWLMTKAMFWQAGGYDERLSGYYGTDGDWRRRLAATAPMAVLTDALVRHEFVADASTTHYLRKQPEDAAVKRIVAARTPGWTPKVLTFPYVEVGAA